MRRKTVILYGYIQKNKILKLQQQLFEQQRQCRQQQHHDETNRIVTTTTSSSSSSKETTKDSHSYTNSSLSSNSIVKNNSNRWKLETAAPSACPREAKMKSETKIPRPTPLPGRWEEELKITFEISFFDPCFFWRPRPRGLLTIPAGGGPKRNWRTSDGGSTAFYTREREEKGGKYFLTVKWKSRRRALKSSAKIQHVIPTVPTAPFQVLQGCLLAWVHFSSHGQSNVLFERPVEIVCVKNTFLLHYCQRHMLNQITRILVPFSLSARASSKSIFCPIIVLSINRYYWPFPVLSGSLQMRSETGKKLFVGKLKLWNQDFFGQTFVIFYLNEGPSSGTKMFWAQKLFSDPKFFYQERK